MSARPWSRPALCAALVVAALAGAPLLFGERWSGLDHTRNLLAEFCAHHDGRLVLDRLRGDGPVLEDPQGLVFSPVVRVLALLPPETAANAFTWIWLVLAAPCAAYLAGSFGVARRGRFVAGVAQALLGTTIDLVLHGSFLVEAALVPLVWAGARNLRRRASPRVGDVLAVSAGLALLAVHGDLVMDLCAGALVIAEALAVVVSGARTARAQTARAALSPKNAVAARVALLALASLAGTLLACVQLLPSAGLGAAVARAHGVDSTTVWPLELPEAFGVVAPLVMHHRYDVGVTLVNAWHGDITTRSGWNSSPFVGALALACLLAASSTKRGRALGIVGAIAFLLSLGAATPFFRVALTLVPPLGLFRYPAKYFELTSICAAVAAGLVVDALRSRGLQQRVLVAAVAIGAALACAFVVLVVEHAAVDEAVARVAVRAPIAGVGTVWSGVLAAVAQSTAFCGAAIVVVVIARRKRGRGPARWLAALVLLEIGVAGVRAMPLGPPLFAESTAAPRPLQQLPAGSTVCIGRDIKAVHLDGADKSVDGGELQLFGDTLGDVMDGKPNIGSCGGPSTPDDYMPSGQSTVVKLSRFLQDEAHGVLGPARALGCDYVVTRAVVDAPRVPLDGPPGAAAVYLVPDALTDAVAPDAVFVDADALLDRVVASQSAAEVLALVDDPAATGAPAALPDGRTAAAVHVAFTSSTEGVVRVDGTGGAVVALRRAWWPGWSATQNGRSLRVVRVAGHALGVVVDDVTAGPIELRYRVKNLGAGVVAACAGALLLALLCAFLSRSRRRRT